jgi:tRNA dimethylallyltransferase
MQHVLVIVGPTASGKSALAVRLAKNLNGEVISADSRQVYKGLDIGTGKVTKKEMQGVKHHLLDVRSPKSTFTANDFVRFGRRAIKSISKSKKLPIICGGTGFYIDALLGRIDISPVAPSKQLRSQLKKKSVRELFQMLREIDEVRASEMNQSDRNNPVRVIRAIEIATHGPMKTLEKSVDYDVLWVGILPDDQILRDKIHKRLVARVKNGMMQEAVKLHKDGLSWKRMEELGLEYRYLALYLQRKLTKDQMLEQLESKIWHYAKRQKTYWKRNREIQWFSTPDEALKVLTSGR